MQAKLLDFITSLRKHEVRISTSESLDAMRVLALVGYSDRQQLKHSLAVTLAKTVDEKAIFNRVFELFYSRSSVEETSETTEEQGRSDEQTRQDQEQENDAGPAIDLEAEVAADPAIQNVVNAPLVQLLLENNPTRLEAALAQAATQVPMQDLRYFTQTGQYTRKLMQAVGSDDVDQSIEDLQSISSDNSNADYLVNVLRNRRDQLRGLAKEQIEKQFLLTANAEGKKLREDALRNSRLSNLEQRHFDDLQVLIRKIAKKLAARHSRRLKVEKRGRLDVAKTLRKNVHHDGILFNTHWKKKRKDKPKVMALCDVSGSVSSYAKFLLLFLYSLNDVLPKIRSFCFSNRTGEVTDLFDRYDAARAIEIAFKQWGMGGSDYGRSFNDFSNLCLNDIDSNTTVIILGDARNNNGEARLDILQSIYHRSKTVIWLNPERRSSWGTGDSEMRRYQSAVHFVSECQSLQQLERVVDQLLKLIR